MITGKGAKRISFQVQIPLIKDIFIVALMKTSLIT